MAATGERLRTLPTDDLLSNALREQHTALEAELAEIRRPGAAFDEFMAKWRWLIVAAILLLRVVGTVDSAATVVVASLVTAMWPFERAPFYLALIVATVVLWFAALVDAFYYPTPLPSTTLTSSTTHKLIRGRVIAQNSGNRYLANPSGTIVAVPEARVTSAVIATHEHAHYPRRIYRIVRSWF
jgi:hypothetical protein